MPLLEVNSQVWSPDLLKDIGQLEAVQCRFTKTLLAMHAINYPERLKLLGLERLEDRRITADVLFVYKLLFGLSALQADNFLYCVSLHVLEANHPYKLSLPRYSTDVRKCFFSHRIVKIWNELPIHTDFNSITSCERALAGFNFTACCDF